MSKRTSSAAVPSVTLRLVQTHVPTRSWSTFAPWQASQLLRLASFDPERAETIMNTLWAMYPSLRAELAISAVDAGELTVTEAAETLGIEIDEVERKLEAFQMQRRECAHSRIIETQRGPCVDEAHVAVWEIVREYRKLGSVERLTEAFPSLTHGQLGAALAYARAHPEEIELAIARYEETRQRKREEYPFS